MDPEKVTLNFMAMLYYCERIPGDRPVNVRATATIMDMRNKPLQIAVMAAQDCCINRLTQDADSSFNLQISLTRV
jgi:hypothetical protein